MSRAIHSARRRWLGGVALKLFYVVFYGGVGVYLMFFAPYLRGLGFSGEQIAAVTLLSPFVGIGAALAWATIADRIGAASRALRWCAALAVLPLLCLPFARTPWQVGVVLVAYNLTAPAMVPLIDSITFEWLKTAGAGSYTRTRLFGSFGGLVAVQALGLVLSARGERADDLAVPLAMIAIVVVLALLAQVLPDAPPPDRRPSMIDVAALARDPRLRLFLFVCLVHGIGYAPYDLFFGVFLRDQGLPSSFMGIGLAGGTIAEIALMFVFPMLERRVRASLLLAVPMLGIAVRWSLLATSHSAARIAALQVLHGACVGLYWGAVVAMIGQLVPARLRVTGHALFAAVVVGGGNTFGYWLAGVGYERLGGAGPLFQIASALELVPLVLVLALGRRLAAMPMEAA